VRLWWEPPNHGLSRGWSPEGIELAQVGHIRSREGEDIGWIVWLTLEQGELFDQFPTIEAAQAAAEAALEAIDQDGGP
jgi:hypothetical protein